MPLIDTPLLHRLSRALDLHAARQMLISSNMANIDTPGFRTRDIDFRNAFAAAMETNLEPAAVVRPVRGLLERPDGNNVNLERESLLLAETQLRFRAEAELVRAEFRRLLAAINEGR